MQLSLSRTTARMSGCDPSVRTKAVCSGLGSRSNEATVWCGSSRRGDARARKAFSVPERFISRDRGGFYGRYICPIYSYIYVPRNRARKARGL